MRREIFHRGLDGIGGSDFRGGTFGGRRRERAIEIFEGARRINYFRHGLGFGLATPCAIWRAQACTSSSAIRLASAVHLGIGSQRVP
jgi:hypothetical protein